MANKMYTPETATTTVRIARDDFDTRTKNREDAKKNDFERKSDAMIKKICRRMARKGKYTLSLRTVKRINGGRLPYFYTVNAPDSDWKERSKMQEDLDKGYNNCGYGKWADFMNLAITAGLKFSYRWKLDPRKKKFCVDGFYVHFKR